MSNTTAIQYHVWKPEPLARGTFSILSTCLTTMTFCVWTAVHLNLPEYKKESAQFWRKVKWLFIALIAPEIVALCAFWQRKDADDIGAAARKAFNQPDPPGWRHQYRSLLDKSLGAPAKLWHALCSTLRKLGVLLRILPIIFRGPPPRKNDDEEVSTTGDKLHNDEISSSPQQRHPWTSTHSLYAAMGGFALDTHGELNNFLPRNRRRILLTCWGVTFLLQKYPSLIPNIPEATIKDKSKASGVVKAFVCLQAAWFCAQCVSRWQQHLSVSLLEINTLVHALCALLIYTLWWNKPMEVVEPTLIRGEQSYEIVSYMCLCSWGKRGIRFATEEYHSRSVPVMKYVAKARDLEPSIFRSQVIKERGLDGDVPSKPLNDDGTKHIHQGQYAHGFQLMDRRDGKPHHILKFQPVDITCLIHARKALDTRPDLFVEPSYLTLSSDRTMVDDRLANNFHPQEYNSLSVYTFTFFLTGLFYGGIHLIAWHYVFRTDIESLLWKISCLTIIAFGGAFRPLAYVLDINYNHSLIEWSLAGLFYLGIVFYAIARIFIIIESFLNVFHLQDSAFQVPQWLQYFWHVG